MPTKTNARSKDIFNFKRFAVEQRQNAMKVGTDGILLGAIAAQKEPKKILDIGTGTGLIALMLAQKYQDAQIVGVEIDSKFAKEAQSNFAASPWSDRLHIAQESIQDFSSKTKEFYDLIVSNPPFYTGGTLSESQSRNSVRHTQKLSHLDLLASVRKLLKKEGAFYTILPIIEGIRFKEIAINYGFQLHRQIRVIPAKNKQSTRLILCFKSRKSRVKQAKEENIVLYDEDGNRTEAYHILVKDYYL